MDTHLQSVLQAWVDQAHGADAKDDRQQQADAILASRPGSRALDRFIKTYPEPPIDHCVRLIASRCHNTGHQDTELEVVWYPIHEVAHVKAEPVETHDLLDTAASSASAAAEPAHPATLSGAGASAKGIKDVAPAALRKRPSDNPELSASAPPPSKKLLAAVRASTSAHPEPGPSQNDGSQGNGSLGNAPQGAIEQSGLAVDTPSPVQTPAVAIADAARDRDRPPAASGAGASAKGVKDVAPAALRKRTSDDPEPSASAPPPSKKLRDIAENIYPLFRNLNSHQFTHVMFLVTQILENEKPAPDRLFDASKALKILKESVTYLPRPARVLERPLDSAPSEVLEDISTALVVRLEKVDEALFSITGWKIKPNDPEEEVDMTQGGSRPSPAGLEGPDDPFNDQIPLRSRPPTIVEVAKFTTVFEYYFDEDVYQLLPGGRRLRDLSKMSRQEDASFCVKVVSGSGSGTAEKDEKARRVFARTRALQCVADRLGCILDTSQCTVMYEGMKDVAGPVRPLIESLLESWGEISIIKFIMGDQWSPPEIIT